MVNWKENNYPFKNFTEELTQEWINCGFNKKETREWLESDLQSTDFGFAQWLRDIENKDAEWLLDYGDEKGLREKHKNYYQLSENVIKQIKKIEIIRVKNYYALPLEQKPLVEQLIPNEKLRERYKKFGLCKECSQPNNEYDWCKPCNSKHFQQKFKNWTSGNLDIDRFIQKTQMEATSSSRGGILEWIPYDRFENIEYLAEGGFGKVYRTKWIDGCIKNWNAQEKKWERARTNPYNNYNGIVVLKNLHNSQNITKHFLQEIGNHKKMCQDTSRLVDCFGISYDPEAGNYVMVMECIGENIRKHLIENLRGFEDKLIQLYDIANGLSSIHNKNLVHRDFHTGNILCRWTKDSGICSYITDLGLSRPANEKDDNKVYGVLPYVAPEVLSGEKYTQAADVYSFGIMAYEILTDKLPFFDFPYDNLLALKICRGLRPKFNIKIPQLLEDLIKKCWDADPLNRPSSSEIIKILNDWLDFSECEFTTDHERIDERIKKIIDETNNSRSQTKYEIMGCIKLLEGKLSIRKDTKFYQQYLESEEYNKAFPNEEKFTFHKSQPRMHSSSCLLDFKNLPKPQNSQEINDKFYSSCANSKSLTVEIPELISEEIEARINLLSNK